VALFGGLVEVGVRQLRDHLSRYLDQVKAGTEIVVTEHDRPVARIVAVNGERVIDRLVAEGLVTPSTTRKRSAPRRLVKPRGTVSDLVGEQRR